MGVLAFSSCLAWLAWEKAMNGEWQAHARYACIFSVVAIIVLITLINFIKVLL